MRLRLVAVSILLVLLIPCLVVPSLASSPLLLSSPNAQVGGYFGQSVAISGSLAVVGAAHENDSGFSHASHAYVINPRTSAMVQTLTSPNAHNYSEFGSSVAISGSLAVVGAYNENASGYSWAGHAYVFNAKTGALIQTLISPDPQADGEFGSSVSVSGNIAMVGAPIETVGGFSQAGCAYVFNAKTGALIQTLTSPNARSGYFGASIAISGSLAVAGVGGETAGGFSGAGHAYTYSKGWLYS